MSNSETAWEASIDYEGCGEAVGTQAKLVRARGARATIRAAGYLPEVICSKREEATRVAQEITETTGVPMRVSEIVFLAWPV
tara:strand:- start:2336 stop:2581 length:246 start_codon:yes stop_codon:yes gene_type:complete